MSTSGVPSAAPSAESSGSSGCIRPKALHSTQGSWWREAVVYQIYPRSFADSTGDGVGDLPGIISRLEHLADLGVGALWLCPFYPSPGHDAGYDVADYQGVDPAFGTLADFDELVARAHSLGITVVLDVVVNHTSHEHEWFRAAADPASPMRDWYIWRDPRPGHIGGQPGAEPTNWGAAFGGSAWTWHPESGQYYFSLFSPYQPDLNWANPELRAAVATTLRWWLERGVDGFRLDVINFIDKPPVLVDAELSGNSVGGAQYADATALAMNGPRLLDYLRELRREVLGTRRDVLLLGETPGVSVAQAVALTDPLDGPLDLVFAFEHCELDREPARWRSRPLDLRELKAWATRWQTGDGAHVWNSLFLSSHDQARIVSRYGDDGGPVHAGTAEGGPGPWWARSATAWATVLHAHRGTPFVYQGDEIAMTNYPFGSLDDFADIEARGVYRDAVAAGAAPGDVLAGLGRLSRDNGRTPMQWDSSAQGGFTTATPWLAVNPNHAWLNVAAQAGAVGAGSAPTSVLAYYRALIALRRKDVALAAGEVSILAPEDEAVYAVERVAGNRRLLIVANLTGVERDWPQGLDPAWVDAELVLSNLATNISPSAAPCAESSGSTSYIRPDQLHSAAESTRLQPWEALVLRRIDTQ